MVGLESFPTLTNMVCFSKQMLQLLKILRMTVVTILICCSRIHVHQHLVEPLLRKIPIFKPAGSVAIPIRKEMEKSTVERETKRSFLLFLWKEKERAFNEGYGRVDKRTGPCTCTSWHPSL
uniref:Uncharacterized protein n=1 Tax=Cucumis melo TaxID=3656 RepID=A0A9I9E8U4_CUCME